MNKISAKFDSTITYTVEFKYSKKGIVNGVIVKVDQKDFDLILKAYKFKKRKKGARQIMMVLDNEFNVHFNLKKIRRLMRKFGLKCPIRQANPYRRMMKATQEHTTCENIVNRVFKTGIPYSSPGTALYLFVSIFKELKSSIRYNTSIVLLFSALLFILSLPFFIQLI